MKAQMRFQKILMFVSLIVAALTFVYAIFFLTGSMGYAIQYKGNNSINAEELVKASQSFVDSLVTIAIVFILLAAALFVTSCHSRRNYYITNYIAVGLFVAFALFIIVYLIINVSSNMNMFLNDINWAVVPEKAKALNNMYPMSKDDTYVFAVGYVLVAILFINAALLVLSTVWKVLLMKGEKKLLEGPAKAQTEEVA